ncbi:uncharacterized protein LOC130980661 [Arachis stenosperma]|uniref:uncharacterized protein LOC130980661 n=1 Tax=Arachis stenosperma TaxID=217475 RepID=UPI0025ABEECC|nr:uncharacterized protein LOC130980661 [Arachis stenosperma]
MEALMKRYGVMHKVATTYHPQTNFHSEAYQTVYNTPLGMGPFWIVYGMTCHFPVEIEHKAYWAVKQYNMDFTQAGDEVLFYNSRLYLMPGKLCSRWNGPYKVKEVKPYGVMKLFHPQSGTTFKVNGHQVKRYHGYKSQKELEVYLLMDALV